MPTLTAPLSDREVEVLGYIAKGYSNKRIAPVLNISPCTVRNHVSSIMVKLNASNRAHAVALANSINILF